MSTKKVKENQALPDENGKLSRCQANHYLIIDNVTRKILSSSILTT